ncbi:uncharacterized protein A4U43_C09F9760 [Asparagus officinalis]|uniref:Uncharacterized protein n=1 Tax=Asparagus officinalis TaxID=4686 RepID=A0A5P1E9T1_ASPOF|nr:uncharacterized protein A4U43_C09F9760 [Asparagus officinalis]
MEAGLSSGFWGQDNSMMNLDWKPGVKLEPMVNFDDAFGALEHELTINIVTSMAPTTILVAHHRLITPESTDKAQARFEAAQQQKDELKSKLAELVRACDLKATQLQAETNKLEAVRVQAAPIDSRTLRERA